MSGSVFFLGGNCPGRNWPGGTVCIGIFSGGELPGKELSGGNLPVTHK